ncbi:hypothetical protein Lesp02_31790 [Lentzea sp. NBRC 105346]|uniref:hypothetical protein n=1 Tax=Lentzea sp. NBRC 105346 TaxID=3032205 RepID=UPI0024A246E2|nr:hypothetical protein [Lentzea sp. NBRC 105346]GLZ30990.1 hypothetical protein Lesp02_31790 [Lentzea sp. NBRC 105346]
MIETAALAGFWAAHGIWSVSDGETLIPILAYEHADGERGWDRYLIDDDIGVSARAAQEAFETNEHGALRAVLVIDTYLHSDEGRRDALLVEAVRYGLEPLSIKMAVPYLPKTESSDFAVFSPKFMEDPGFDEAAVADAFFAGVDSHDHAAPVWNAHLHPSAVQEY